MIDTIHIQSEAAREKITNVFCKLIACSALFSVGIYLYLKLYEITYATGIIGVLFLLFLYLNKKQYQKISRAGIIVTTNLGTLFFSLYLGFESGIYLYLFIAPFLVYLLFDFNDIKVVLTFMLMYLCTFIIIFTYQNTSFCIADTLDEQTKKVIYSFNFCSTFMICFGLVIYFAKNNDKYIQNLKNHKELLSQEIKLRTDSEELLKKSLREREILLAETHHRVKNNLSIISALVNLQTENLKDEQSRKFFEETRNRIHTMALIHNLLYQNKSFEKIDFVQYVNKFSETIFGGFQNKSNIVIKQEIEDINIDLKTAIPLALIINELVTNAYKHAFKNIENGVINIGINKINDHQILFWIKDNGIGMDADLFNSNTMGLTIIQALIEQIEATLKYQNNNGSLFEITIPLTK